MVAAIVVVGVVVATIIVVAVVRTRPKAQDPWDDGGQSLRDLKAWQKARKAGGSRYWSARAAGTAGFWGVANNSGGGNFGGGSGDLGSGGSCGGGGGCGGGGCGGGGCGGGGCGPHPRFTRNRLRPR
ncbi:hypothetical protein FK535_18700 [Mycolicibacterium sp. 018/SC-01/001]|nr:hypothetical protein FK535_18700 [Mycolicibacterium sp. 018/SC-01/001]